LVQTAEIINTQNLQKQKLLKNFKGICIPEKLCNDKYLTWIEKLFLARIISLNNSDGCIARNKEFAEFFNMSRGRCSQIISSLIKKKYISVRYQVEKKV